MTQTDHTIESRKGKHLNYTERTKIESWKQLNPPLSNRKIAEMLERSPQTIHTEVKDGTVRQVKRQVQNGKTYEYEYFVYSASAGQAAYEQARKRSGKQQKWINAPKFMAYADYKMKEEKWSPDTIVGYVKKHQLFPDEDIPCASTLYRYIDCCLMNTRNIDLSLKTRRKPTIKRKRENKTKLGNSIEQRPDCVAKRERFGDWEIDTVIGVKSGKDQALLTLTERKTRYELIVKIENKSADPVNQLISDLKGIVGEDFKRIFQTITADNGSEFSGISALLEQVTDVYFTHPYSSWERGTNENHNGIIRRFIPKGSKLSDVSTTTIERVQNWMNNLPRKILDYATPQECFLEEISKWRERALTPYRLDNEPLGAW